MNEAERDGRRRAGVSRRSFLGGIAVSAAVPSARIAAAEERIGDLLARMTPEEKAGQLTVVADPFRWRPGGVNPDDMNVDEARIAAEIRAGRLVPLLEGYTATGSPLNGVYLGGRTMPRKLRALIDFAVADIGRSKML